MQIGVDFEPHFVANAVLKLLSDSLPLEKRRNATGNFWFSDVVLHGRIFKWA